MQSSKRLILFYVNFFKIITKKLLLIYIVRGNKYMSEILDKDYFNDLNKIKDEKDLKN